MDREEKRGEERQTGDWPVFKLAPSKQTPVFWGVSGRPDKRETGQQYRDTAAHGARGSVVRDVGNGAGSRTDKQVEPQRAMNAWIVAADPNASPEVVGGLGSVHWTIGRN